MDFASIILYVSKVKRLVKLYLKISFSIRDFMITDNIISALLLANMMNTVILFGTIIVHKVCKIFSH